MSKLQKALDALRNMPVPDDKQVGGGRSFAKQKSQPAHNESAEVLGPNWHNDVDTDLKPIQTVHIDVERLVELRMLPPAADEELIAQQFKRIKRPIIQLAFDNDLVSSDCANVIMMASALPGAGKSFCAMNLANSIALERDFGVILIDADVLKPGISRALGLDQMVGLIDYLVEPDIDISDIMYASDMKDIIVIPSGKRHPETTELLASRRMRDLVQNVSRRYRNHAIVFDTPPLLLTSEAQILAERVGQIVLVIEARESSQEAVMRALAMLDRDKPINAILNKSRSADSGGYYSDNYGYYSSPLQYAKMSAGNDSNN
ncbi:MAG TPA: AAA family ATPase [Woeseiaceae bacterium]|nr:AAA family ATPase [Woeseiaceae bacterium]